MLRWLGVVLVLVGSVSVLARPAAAQEAGAGESPVEPPSLAGFAYAVTQEYAAEEIVRGETFDLARYDGLFRVSVTVSRFEDAERARAAYEAMQADLLPAIETSSASSGLRIENLRAQDVAGMGDAAHGVSFAAISGDFALDSRYLLVVEGDLFIELVALAIGEAHLPRVDAIAAAVLAREPGRGGVEGLAALFPAADDPVLAGLVPTTSSRETPVAGG